jgi:lysophospholipase L1-like esterase
MKKNTYIKSAVISICLTIVNCLNINNTNDSVSLAPFEVAGYAFPNDSIFYRSLISGGNNYRIHRFISKCKSQSEVTVGFIGGSITDGAVASSKSKRYSSLFCQYIKQSFNSINVVHEINAGIGATHSRFGCSRVKEDLLQYKPDFIVIEFAVNDWDIKDTNNIHMYMEGLVRQCLNYNFEVPVMLLYFARGDGTNVQLSHIDVGLHYSLPMISYRDVIWPIIEKDKDKNWSIFFYDNPHPNDNGHRVCASLLYSYLKTEIEKKESAGVVIPEYKYSDLFENAYVLHSSDLVTIKNENWIIETKEKSRMTFKSGHEDRNSVLSLITNAQEISFGIHMQPTDTSNIIIECNGEKCVIPNYYSFEYTRFISVNPDSSKTCVMSHSGSSTFIIDYVLLSN